MGDGDGGKGRREGGKGRSEREERGEEEGVVEREWNEEKEYLMFVVFSPPHAVCPCGSPPATECPLHTDQQQLPSSAGVRRCHADDRVVDSAGVEAATGEDHCWRLRAAAKTSQGHPGTRYGSLTLSRLFRDIQVIIY